tara:strand:+ start:617 stop:847 length:231 start_codon:yes stop_codon:yes gene_type:complete
MLTHFKEEIMEDKFEGLMNEWFDEKGEVENLFLNNAGFPYDLEDMPDREECRQIAATLLLVQAVRDVRDAINNLNT